MGIKGDSLVSRLRLHPKKDGDFVPLPGPFLRKYIAYARSLAFPRISKPAAEVIQKFYLKVKTERHTSADTPITARQLESLVRLAKAQARVDLRLAKASTQICDFFNTSSVSFAAITTTTTSSSRVRTASHNSQSQFSTQPSQRPVKFMAMEKVAKEEVDEEYRPELINVGYSSSSISAYRRPNCHQFIITTKI